MNWLYDHVRIRWLFILAAALGLLSMLVSPAEAAQTRTFTITKPAGYADGTPFGTETLVYIVYDADTNTQLFSTFQLVVTKNTIPDSTKCFYARAGVFNETTQNVLVGPDGKSTISDPSPNSCTPTPPPPAPATKKVGSPGLGVK